MIMLGYVIVSTMQEKVILSMMQGNFSSFVSIL